MENYFIFNMQNRRYIGSKTKLLKFIFDELKILKFNSFADIFAGTGVVSELFITKSSAKKIIINDFLYSNNVIYEAFLKQSNFDKDKLLNLANFYNNLENLKDNYFSVNFGDKFFSMNDAKKIGFIRENLENHNLNSKEKSIVLASLIYSMDKVANTVGHFEAYRKDRKLRDSFEFNLINPIKTDKEIKIFKKDANDLVKLIYADLIFIDPPYNSRQYSRFYHVYENIVKWKKPPLFGKALKPREENMSEYCRNLAPKFLENLIENIDAKFIALTYNNTYNSKSSSSKNKINFNEIVEILSKKGNLTIKEKPHSFFNAGKSSLNNHKEFLFIVEVRK
ncbi:adenine methyltransferase [Campylobacter sp. FMV-PI01]|uniref:site-specific DNA-methyltransferase (adenine-specific) n=1 Tax=Campylobacter portucalensis TaxID=2608384 RepID=A0A6L5WHX5_9BACT|nr:DNA adenine methylase [Campylobacter portucalensis]MSN95847.1 adenine methyltransferase [Campylobacter portucalensis]